MEPLELTGYLEELRRRGRLSPDALAELEDHLLTTIEADMRLGSPLSCAEHDALSRLGPLRALAIEFKKETSMNPLSRLFGIAFSLGTLFAVIAPGAGVASFVDLPSMILVAGLVAGGLLASFGPRATLRAALQAVTRAPAPGREVGESLRVARHGYHLSWAAGAVGVLIGVVNLLSNLEDPSRVGAGVGLALLSLLYGGLLAELLFSNLHQWLASA